MSYMVDRRAKVVLNKLETHCQRLNLMASDFGKAINRIKVKGYAADLDGLKLEVSKDASSELELVAMAFAAFKSAQKVALGGNRYESLHSMGEYDSTIDHTDVHLDEMKRAVEALNG